MRSLATGGADIQGGGFAGVERLRNVRIENGWVYGNRGDVCEPLGEYFRGKKPHVELAELPWTTKDLIQFSERYGAVVGAAETEGSGQSNSKTRIVAFREAFFWLEQWCFAFLLKLAAARENPDKLRTVFHEALDDARDKCWRLVSKEVETAQGAGQIELLGHWQSIVRELHRVLDAPQPTDPAHGKLEQDKLEAIRRKLQHAVDEEDRESAIKELRDTLEAGDSKSLTIQFAKALLESSRRHLAPMRPAALKKAATGYLSRAINEELSKLKPLLDLSSEKGPELYSLCDNLKQRLYWMLALDLAGRRVPHICISCKDFFLSSREDAVYCGKLKCKERERKRRNWDKHRNKYNRARREEYRSKRQRTTKVKEQMR